jgi:alkanesulfonate monooxygenase SsuD/methylene tetrahydromethanopterin reductase-like flavin-dependent oxidoreductase (luciferase family)
VRFGVSYNTGAYGVVDPDAMIAVTQHAEDRGFESFYLPEHVALYPGASLGAVGFPPDLPIADPLESPLTRAGIPPRWRSPAGARST